MRAIGLRAAGRTVPSRTGRIRAGVRCAVAAVLIALSAQTAAAQTARTIKIVVPLPPGGAGDILARHLAEQVGQAHGITVVTENRPGAGTVIGTDHSRRENTTPALPVHHRYCWRTKASRLSGQMPADRTTGR